jgi:hypothetical protein
MGLKSSNPSTGGEGSHFCKIRWNFAALRNRLLVAADALEERNIRTEGTGDYRNTRTVRQV